MLHLSHNTVSSKHIYNIAPVTIATCEYSHIIDSLYKYLVEVMGTAEPLSKTSYLMVTVFYPVFVTKQGHQHSGSTDRSPLLICNSQPKHTIDECVVSKLYGSAWGWYCVLGRERRAERVG